MLYVHISPSAPIWFAYLTDPTRRTRWDTASVSFPASHESNLRARSETACNSESDGLQACTKMATSDLTSTKRASYSPPSNTFCKSSASKSDCYFLSQLLTISLSWTYWLLASSRGSTPAWTINLALFNLAMCYCPAAIGCFLQVSPPIRNLFKKTSF